MANRAAINQAKQNVEASYVVVGVLEELNMSLAVLEHSLPGFFQGVESLYHLELGQPHRNRQGRAGSISPQARQLLGERLAMEQVDSHTVTQSHSHAGPQSHSNTVTQSHSHTVTQSHSFTVSRHTVLDSYNHTVTRFNVTQSHSNTVTIVLDSHSHTITQSHSHIVLDSHSQTVTYSHSTVCILGI